MEILSLLIMALGVVALLAIYFYARASRKGAPQQRKLPPIHQINDSSGKETSSILEDHPARDGKIPNAPTKSMSDLIGESEAGMHSHSNTVNTVSSDPAASKSSQVILFIAAPTNEEFTGSEVLEALDNAGLVFGDMHVYHRLVLGPQGEQSLFYVANGIKPWTLVPEEMAISSTPGLSLILNLPSAIPNNEAIRDFVHTAQQVNQLLGGILKNQNQQVVSDAELNAYLAS